MRALGLPLRTLLFAVSLPFRFYYWMVYRRRKLFFEPVKEILLIALGPVSRVLMATPLIHALKRRFPQARLTVLVSPRAIEVLDASPWVDELLVHDASWHSPEFTGIHRLRDCWNTGRFLGRQPFDLSLDIAGGGGLDALLVSLVPARFRAGFNVGGWGFALTHRVRVGAHVHRVDANLLLAASLGASGGDPKPFLRVRMEDEKITAALLEDKGIDPLRDFLVGLHPGASVPSRQWGEDRFTETARLLTRAGARVLVFGGLLERDAARAIKKAVPECLNLSGKTGVRQMASLVARCRVFVGNDAGPGHVAASMGVPCVIAFSGAHDPRDQAPRGARCATLTHPVSCSPCRLEACRFQGEKRMNCLRPVTPGEVVDAALRFARPADGGVAGSRLLS